MLTYDIKSPVRNGEIKMPETNQSIDKILIYKAQRIIDLRCSELAYKDRLDKRWQEYTKNQPHIINSNKR